MVANWLAKTLIQRHHNPPNEDSAHMTKSVDNGWVSSTLFHRIGYGLLVLALIDLLNILLPPSPRNPNWVFQTIGALVERVPVTLLGLGLVFYGEADFRSKWERLLLKFLSWGSLLAGVLFVLLAPLLLQNTVQLDNQINYQINTQVTQQLSGLEQIESRLANATTPQDINNVIARLNIRGLPSNNNNTEQLKSRLLSEITKAKQTVRPKIQASWANRRLGLLKNAIKWFLGAVVSGSVLVYIWFATRWARRGNRWSR